MARARNIKPGFFANELLAECDPLARILFAGLWCLADREGRLEDRAKRIRAELLPYDMCDADVLLNQLQEHGFILRYERDGKRLIQVLNFGKHQNPHVKEGKSILPAPEDNEQVEDKHSTSTVQEQCEHQTSQADSGFLIPDSLNLIPDALIPDSVQELCDPDESVTPQVVEQEVIEQGQTGRVIKFEPVQPKADIPSDMPGPKDQSCKTFKAWANYAFAYRKRYSTWPVWNAKSAGQVSQLVDRLGQDVAHHVAAYYLTINDARLINDCHSLNSLLAKAEAIHTQWVTGRQMNSRTARQMEDTQANINAAQEAASLIKQGGNKNAFL
ncbi:phage replication protein [Pseudomonas luteola]|uniref:phage replication protein n=1 Tax=Pseudomonas luteola TaxID=47886 RepID=UPI003A83FECF